MFYFHLWNHVLRFPDPKLLHWNFTSAVSWNQGGPDGQQSSSHYSGLNTTICLETRVIFVTLYTCQKFYDNTWTCPPNYTYNVKKKRDCFVSRTINLRDSKFTELFKLTRSNGTGLIVLFHWTSHFTGWCALRHALTFEWVIQIHVLSYIPHANRVSKASIPRKKSVVM